MPNQISNIHHASGTVMGGPWQIRHVPIKNVSSDQVAAAALRALQLVDAQMSNYREDSDLMRLNAAPLNEFIPIPVDMHTVMTCAETYAQLSGGALNIALGQLVNLWGFGPEDPPEYRPQNADIKAKAALAAPGNFVMHSDPPAIFKHVDVGFDLCSLAKGFAVDQAARAVEALGVTNFLIEAAGEIYASGSQPNGAPWRIGLELPVPSEDRIIFDEITLEGIAAATTGNYRNHHLVEGQDISHTIDPTTGAPLTGDLLSVTVLHKTCMDADALATVLYVLGAGKGPKFAAENELAALFLIREPEGMREIRSEAFVTTAPH